MFYEKFDKNLISEYKKILIDNLYGDIPDSPVKILSLVKKSYEEFGGKAIVTEYLLRAITSDGDALVFPIKTCFPKGANNNKTIISLHIEKDKPLRLGWDMPLTNPSCPAEEIIDRNWNLVTFNLLEFNNNNGRRDFNNDKILYKYCPNSGKMAFFVWAVSRVVDFLFTLDEVDKKNIGVIGNERAGRIAMVATAFDDRIAFIHANCTGTTGACLFESQTKDSQSIEDVILWFGWAYNKKFHEYFESGEKMPFDQHLHGYLIAPRPISVGVASEDLFTNPTGSFDFCKAISNAYESYGKKGFIAPTNFKVSEKYHDGKVGFYCRQGTHYLNRTDWNNALDFFDKNLNK